ncbi:MAG: (d)CMP kinase [Nanoarchaeota archaeon]
MKITISGIAGSGKSTAAKSLSKKLKLKHYSTGNLMRSIAKKRKVSLLKLSKIAEKDNTIDKELDDRQRKLGIEQDDFVIDGRLSALFIPKADFKIYLDCGDETRAKRILKDGRAGEKSKNVNEMIKKINEREKSERKRYKKYYDYDYQNKTNYNLAIDTTNMTVEEMVQEILDFLIEEAPKHL